MTSRHWSDGFENLPKAVGNFDVKPENIALLVIDMQYYVAHREYGVLKNYLVSNPEAAAYYDNRLKVIVPNVGKLIEFFRKNNLPVFFAAFGASMKDGSDLHPLRKMTLDTVPASMLDDFENKILEEITPRQGELVASKSTRSAFTGTVLDHKMRFMGIETVVTVGVATEVCVSSSARNAWDLGYKVVMVNDATGAFTEEDQNVTMRNWAAFFGKVVDTDELIAALS